MNFHLRRFLTFSLLLFALALPLIVSAQSGDPTLPGTGQELPLTISANKTLIWERDDPQCGLIVIDGTHLRIIRNGDITVGVAIGDDGDYYIARTTFVNHSDQSALLDPAISVLYLRDKKNVRQVISALPPSKVAVQIRGRTKWGNFFRAFAAGMASNTAVASTDTYGRVTVTGPGGSVKGDYSGTATTTVTSPDLAARRQAAEASSRANASANADAANALEWSLRANTVFPREYITGLIYFPRKKFDLGVFILPIEGVNYEFMIEPGKKK